jgi:hypothetical protein
VGYLKMDQSLKRDNKFIKFLIPLLKISTTLMQGDGELAPHRTKLVLIIGIVYLEP